MAVTDLPIKRLNSLLEAADIRTVWLSLVKRLALDSYGHAGAQHLAMADVYRDVVPAAENLLDGLSIGEISVLYEFSLAHVSHEDRKSGGRFFTPDDVAQFLAARVTRFPEGKVWLDPCCGVGNLTYWLVAAEAAPERFLREQLWCVDIDELALLIARSLLSLLFFEKDADLFTHLASRFLAGNFLSMPLPAYDYAILNPPYVRAQAPEGYVTAPCQDLYAFFMECVSRDAQGFIAITPQGFTNNAKFSTLRQLLLDHYDGLTIYCFDNIPDAIFRGIKFGSQNTNQVNSTRAAVTIAQRRGEHRITPLLRWVTDKRGEMLARADEFLAVTPFEASGYPKVSAGLVDFWLGTFPWQPLSSYLSATPTAYRLIVPSTPRYFISATLRDLNRSSYHTIYLPDQHTLDQVYLLLNSSYMYWWWRVNDGGMTVALDTLRTLPVPPDIVVDQQLVAALRASEAANVVVKMNAGKPNENVKHPRELVDRLNAHLFEPAVAEALADTHKNSFV